MKTVYDKRTEEIRKALEGKRNCCETNKLYLGVDLEDLFYINTHGFYHILMPGEVRWSNGDIECYTVDDYRLNPDNTLHLTRQTDFATKEERGDYVWKLLEENAA